MLVTNAFSLQMLGEEETSINVGPAVGPATIKTWLLEEGITLESAIGHADTAAVVSGELGVDLAMQRINVTLQQGEELLVAQVVGGRLPEGCTELPSGVKIVYRIISVDR